MIIRQYKEETDYDNLIIFLKECNVYSEGMDYHNLYNQSPIAIEDNKIIGILLCIYGKSSAAFCDNLIVLPNYQNKGIGVRLALTTAEVLRNCGYKYVALFLDENNVMINNLLIKRFKIDFSSERLMRAIIDLKEV